MSETGQVFPTDRAHYSVQRPANAEMLETLQAWVGGYVETIDTEARGGRKGFVLVVNEEGRLKGLPKNPNASQVFQQPLVGQVAYIPEEWLLAESETQRSDA